MAYLKYQDYLAIGGVCDETAFNRNIDRACSAIDNVTYNRLQNMSTVPQKVQACCRDLIEYYAVNANTSEKDVARWSESAGAVSESISYVSKSADDMKNDVYDIIYDYLFSATDDSGRPLMYKGAMY